MRRSTDRLVGLDLVLAGYYWNPLTLDLEDDTDGDGKPDNILHR